MANVKITELTATTNPASTDVLPIVDVSADTTKKVTIADLLENAGNGSASAPAFSFASDSDTGMFRGAENSLRFSTGGSVGLTVASDQNVGIGTAAPSKKLVVTGDAQFNSIIVGRGNGEVSSNTALGASCLDTNTTGGSNVAVGFQCLRLNTEGNSNVAVGRECLEQNTTGSGNVAVGKGPLIANTTGTSNIALGQNAMLDNTVGARNVAIGHQVLQTNVAVSRNTAVGYNAMRYANSSASESAKNNVAYGYQALMGSTTAANNTGGSNVAIGGNTLLDCTTGNSNVAVGHNAGQNVTTGASNVFVGFSAGDSITTGNNNTILGDIAGSAALSSTVIVGAGTAERFRVNSSGNLGVGTSAPNYAFHVKNATAAVASFEVTSKGEFRIEPATDANGHMIRYGGGTDGGTESRILRFVTAGDAERMRIDANGRLLIGTSSSRTVKNIGASLLNEGTTGGGSAIALVRNSNDTGAPGVYFAKTRGTSDGSTTVVQSGDSLGVINFCGADGTDLNTAGASIEAKVDGTPGSNDMPGRLVFRTTADGASSATERMRIDKQGSVIIFNGTAPTSSATNGVKLYAEDVSSSSELKVRDEAGNVTTLSPHNFDLIPEGPSEDMAWSYYSERDGKRINVDMLKAVRLLEQLSGEQLVFTS